jgi:hypothetical protein
MSTIAAMFCGNLIGVNSGMAWIAEGKLNYRNDPNLKD